MILSGFAVTGHIDSQKNSRIFVSEVLPEGLAFNEGTYCLILTSNHTTTHQCCLQISSETLVCVCQVYVQVMRSWC